MIALLRDYFRRSWLIGMMGAAAVLGFFIIACRVFLQIQQQGGGSTMARLVPQWVQAAFSIGPSTMSDINGFMSVCFQHPFVITVILAVPITMITGFLTGDVEKRTLGLILARPVARFQIVVATAIVVLFWSAVALCCVYAGILIGANWTEQITTLNLPGIRKAAGSLALLVLAYTGIAAALGSILNVRSDAVGWAVTIVLTMYVWNFLATIWTGGGLINYSLFHFYQPTEILLHGESKAINNQVLAAVGVIGWITSALAFRLRNFSI